jgi:hypothetical protein
MAALLRDNPHAPVVCAPAAALGLAGLAVSPKLRNDLLRDSYEARLPPQRFVLPLGPGTVTIGGVDLTLQPAVEARSLWLRLEDEDAGAARPPESASHTRLAAAKGARP